MNVQCIDSTTKRTTYMVSLSRNELRVLHMWLADYSVPPREGQAIPDQLIGALIDKQDDPNKI